jgi:hypothetical protein
LQSRTASRRVSNGTRHQNKALQSMRMHPLKQGFFEVLKTVELDPDYLVREYGAELHLRIEVLRSLASSLCRVRLWRLEFYKLEPAHKIRRQGRSYKAGESVLVEDFSFGTERITADTANAAIDAALSLIHMKLAGGGHAKQNGGIH